ncbi:hypothetical protein GCM10017786_68080 [Amycolatopsis deserti]|uniref:Mini-circle protein n=1 Tax=Amycolatopsis deserti TaxID=185696 RepID=A0ABQ3JJ51_9PSEU|nr:DinB family protein [Amycolatopsis deserti]GHF24200.1 hypothetical protein GCM10017786_68080 [Amycolatopsis deserti]
MAGNVRPVADERDGLLAFLAQQRYVLRLAARGLSDEQARLTPTRSALSVGGLIKHVTSTERRWMAAVLRREKPLLPPETCGSAGRLADFAAAVSPREELSLPPEGPGSAQHLADFRLGERETLSGVLAAYDSAARETEEIIGGIEDLGQQVPAPQGMPWSPDDGGAWSVRWVLLHLIQETARHAGHADILREHIDGATAVPLMAAAEGWPSRPWLAPWQPSG